MRFLVKCLYVITELKPLIEFTFISFVIWSLARLIHAKRSTVFTLRDWLGAVGLAMETCSWLLFAWFFIHYWIAHSLIAHGSVLIIYYAVGSSAAVAGMILAPLGRGWMRRSALMVSLVMVLQWLGIWDIDLGLDAWITIAMFMLLLVGGVVLLGIRICRTRTAHSSPA